MNWVLKCSYNIIMSTEIIGLSHMEREIVANVVQYNHLPFEYFDSWGSRTTLDAEAYLVIAKPSKELLRRFPGGSYLVKIAVKLKLMA